jgi:hypothetical protein
MVAKRHKITNVLLFKKFWDIIFIFWGLSLYEPFLGTFWQLCPAVHLLSLELPESIVTRG